MTRLVPNAFLDIIAINDSAKLELTPDQTAKLQTGGDAFKVKSDSLIDSAITVLAATPSFIRTAWSSRRSSGPEPHFERMVLRCLIRSGFRQVLCLD